LEEKLNEKSGQDLSSQSRTVLILKTLERKPLSAKEIHETTTLPTPTLYRRLSKLVADGWITETKGTYALTSKGRQYLELLG
jgi:predicted transcriptional regulator